MPHATSPALTQLLLPHTAAVWFYPFGSGAHCNNNYYYYYTARSDVRRVRSIATVLVTAAGTYPYTPAYVPTLMQARVCTIRRDVSYSDSQEFSWQ